MERTHFFSKHRLAVIAVLSNLAVGTTLALTATGDRQVLVPLVALMLPLLTATLFESSSNTTQNNKTARTNTTAPSSSQVVNHHQELGQAA
ncbi:MAG: hypothetical protein RL701_6036 [Pseudomonadota bacterium]|jgi:hypothetical protein